VRAQLAGRVRPTERHPSPRSRSDSQPISTSHGVSLTGTMSKTSAPEHERDRKHELRGRDQPLPRG